MSDFYWLTNIVVLPIYVGSLIVLLPQRENKVLRWYTICICLFELLLMTYVFCYHFKLDDPLIQLEEEFNWINLFYFHWRLGIDRLSIGSILLTGFITTLATLVSWPVTRNFGQIGSFSSQNLLLFFIMWELELIPFYLLLSMYSATKFILYIVGVYKSRTKVLGMYGVQPSCMRGWVLIIFLLMGVLGMGLYGSNEPTLIFEILANQSYPMALEIIFYFGFLITYAVNSPIIPLHTWLLDTHREVHYSTCMLLTGILLKMGAHRLVWINMKLLPHAHSIFSTRLMIVGTIQIIYAALTSLGQCNLKKRIAYSSISHMGFIIIGISSINDVGLNGAILQITSHGFIGATLFFLAGTSYDRIHLSYLNKMGVAILMPRIFMIPKFLIMSKILITFVMSIGMILTPIHSLSMLCQMFYGYRLFNVPKSHFVDDGPQEIFILMCILLPIIGISIYPDFILSLSVDKVETILFNCFHG
ncbi:unnamed protein product [Victoria cruziana]